MSSPAQTRSPLEVSALIALVTLGIAAVLGIIAVLDESREAAAFGAGLGVAVLVFLSGATIVCGLACLARGRAEIVALASTAVAGVALDLVVFAIWREIENETYTKIAGIAAAWTFFALIALGLTLAVNARGRFWRPLFLGAVISTLVAGLVSTYHIATAGDENSSDVLGGDAQVVFGLSPGDDALLRVLGVSFVLLAALWFGAIAAQRLERLEPADT
jgi:hypothetical protein